MSGYRAGVDVCSQAGLAPCDPALERESLPAAVPVPGPLHMLCQALKKKLF